MLPGWFCPRNPWRIVVIVDVVVGRWRGPCELHRRGIGPFAERVARQHDLPDDFGRGQVAHQLHRAGKAEAAIERAADLARDAQRAAIGIGDEHAFGFLAVVEAQQPFARAVGGDLRGDDLGPPDDEMLRQQCAGVLGDIGEAVDVGRAALVNPVPHLPATHVGLFLRDARRDQRRAQLRLRQPEQRPLAIGTRACGFARNGSGIDKAGDLHWRAYRRRVGRKKGAAVGRS